MNYHDESQLFTFAESVTESLDGMRNSLHALANPDGCGGPCEACESREKRKTVPRNEKIDTLVNAIEGSIRDIGTQGQGSIYAPHVTRLLGTIRDSIKELKS